MVSLRHARDARSCLCNSDLYAGQDLRISHSFSSPHSCPGSAHRPRSASSACPPHLALSLQCDGGPGLVLMAQMAPKLGLLLPYETSSPSRVIRCSRLTSIGLPLARCPSCPRDIPRSVLGVLVLSLLFSSFNFSKRSCVHDTHYPDGVLYHPRYRS